VASHFAPDQLSEAIEVYRSMFNPRAYTARLDKPHLMLAVNVMACPTAAEARRQFTSTEQAFAAIRRGVTGLLPPPVDDLATTCSPSEILMARQMLRIQAVGTPDDVVAQLDALVARTGADEVITVTWAHDPAVRLRSIELTARAWG
jgi:alkanesulfonate monooxygenase SsuD/methylene tetrahydromethanopterin reductase-like flavin-dependent oxidoreductase (luciferase family)